MSTETKKRMMAELCPSPHLEAADITGDTVVTIKAYDWHPVGSEQKVKGVIFFKEFERGMVINKTNRVILQHLFGSYADDMLDQQITIYPSETTFEGKVVPCLRIRAQKPEAARPKLHQSKQTA